MRAYYKIREARVPQSIFEMVKSVGAASHAEVLGGVLGSLEGRRSIPGCAKHTGIAAEKLLISQASGVLTARCR